MGKKDVVRVRMEWEEGGRKGKEAGKIHNMANRGSGQEKNKAGERDRGVNENGRRK